MTVLIACGGDDPLPLGTRPVSTDPPTVVAPPDDATTPGSDAASNSDSPPSTTGAAGVTVQVDAAQRGEAISPLILGLSSNLTAEQLDDLGTTLNSWGGNPSTRYNYTIGHAWNHGSDFEFRNTDYDVGEGDAARGFLMTNAAAGVQSRLAVPTLGWVAKNADPETCSFPDGSGGCRSAGYVGNCNGDGPVADPNLANVASDEAAVAEWVRGLIADGLDPDIIAFDNEPELWGLTHYDVHPVCPTYEEILDKYLTYAEALRDVAPDSLFAGPVMCCWYDYWDIAPGPADGSNEDFLPWFLRNVKAHDDSVGYRTLDIVDVHYYPQSDVYNDDADDSTNMRRIRSARSLWDPEYNDESWIDTTIQFIPRIKAIIEESYPGTPILISEWNFGSEATMNGAVAIAEVLGIYGREGVEAASYWRNPAVDSPGYFAFKMFGNYDDEGSRFGGDVLAAESSDPDAVSAYAAADDEAGVLRVVLINKDPAEAATVALAMSGATVSPTARTYSYGPADLSTIVAGTADTTVPLVIPASSITLLELDLA
ncbi:MAG: glycoside hydrolase family 44 protein [Ilumatobacteraceae bacterium]